MDRYILHIIFIPKWQKHNTFLIISIDQLINKISWGQQGDDALFSYQFNI